MLVFFKEYFHNRKNIKIIFVLGVQKVLWEGVNKIFFEKKTHRGTRNQKSKSLKYRSSEFFFEKG